MAQAFIESVKMEVLGQASFMQMCNVDHIIMEVLGKFQWGTIDVDLVIMEVLGKNVEFANIQHVVMEVIGQWPGF